MKEARRPGSGGVGEWWTTTRSAQGDTRGPPSGVNPRDRQWRGAQGPPGELGQDALLRQAALETLEGRIVSDTDNGAEAGGVWAVAADPGGDAWRPIGALIGWCRWRSLARSVSAVRGGYRPPAARPRRFEQLALTRPLFRDARFLPVSGRRGAPVGLVGRPRA